VEHFAKALALADNPEQSAVIALRYSRALWLSGRFGKSIEVVQRAIDGAEAIATPLREELEAESIGARWGDTRFYPAAANRLSSLREDELAGGIGSDRLLALLAEFEMRKGRNRRRAVALAERSLASGGSCSSGTLRSIRRRPCSQPPARLSESPPSSIGRCPRRDGEEISLRPVG
jgi:hypothetical protein